MKQLEMIEAMAKLEGVGVELVDFDGAICYIQKLCDIYNPIDDDALNLKARDEHKVEIEYHNGHYIIKKWINPIDGYQKLMIKDLAFVKSTVIKCILMANNLWTGE